MARLSEAADGPWPAVRARRGLLSLIASVVTAWALAQAGRPAGEAALAIDTLDLPFTKLTINQGLSQGMVNAIAQDRLGFMWFGTKDGLNRYDGYSFTVFRHDAADTNSLRESTITGLHCDRYGRLWVGTATGLDLFDERTERFIHLPIRHPKGDWGSVVHVVLDDNDDLWVSTTDAMLKLTFAKPCTDYDLPGFIITWLGHGYATVSRTRDGQLWGNINEVTFRIHAGHDGPDRIDTIGVLDFRSTYDRFGALTVVEDTVRQVIYGVYRNGIGVVDPASGSIRFLIQDRKRINWLQSLNPMVDAKGMLWLATFQGLYRFDPFRRRLTLVRTADPEMRMLISSVKWTTIDRTGTLWVGTSGYGLLKYDPRIERFNNWPDHSIRALAPMRDGRLLVSRYERFVDVFDTEARRYVFATRNVSQRWPALAHGLIQETAEMSVEDRDGFIWSFLSHGVLSRLDPATGQLELLRPEVAPGQPDGGFHFPLHIGIDGALWCGGDKALWRIDTRTKACTPFPWPVTVVNNPYPFTTALHQGADGVVWAGTVKGLLRFDPNTQEWKHYAHDTGDPASLAVEVVFSICPDPDEPLHVLWIGTNGGGLNRLDTRSG